MKIQRQVLDKLFNHLKEKEITLITGARQVGKTTLMMELKAMLERKNKKTLFLNLDFDDDQRYFQSQNDFINYVKLHLGTEKGYVFIDEIQRLTNAGLFLKGIYDRNLPYKFIVSGSGSLELKEKIHESLAGRKRVFNILSVNFLEFINYKTNYKFKGNIDNFFRYEKTLPHQLLKEYFCFGGYPKVILDDTLEKKTMTMREIYQSYLEKDIQELLNIEKREVFTQLVIVLSTQIGKLVNYFELSKTLRINYRTLKKYLWYLEKTFIVDKLTPLYSNIRKELVKSPIYYFRDLGLRSYVFNRWILSEKNGFLFQNFVFLLLKNLEESTQAKINFWRTKNGAEVDFIVSYGRQMYPIEVKDTNLKKIDRLHSLMSFINKYKPSKAFIINKSLRDKIFVGETEIIALPYYDLLTKPLLINKKA